MPYLDHNATSPLRPQAWAAMQRAVEHAGNPSAIHLAGRTARATVDDAREQVAKLVKADVNDVVFTSGGTEANALALWGAVQGLADSRASIARLLVSAIEHDSVLKTAAAIAERIPGLELVSISATPDGIVDIEALEQLLTNGRGRALVAVMAANNETGVVQPIADVTALARKANALCLVDAVQAWGKMAVDFSTLGADYLTLSAHKLGGPQGVGALMMRAAAPFAPPIPGGQEKGRRAGTENVVGIAGLGAAAEVAGQDDMLQCAALRDCFEEGLQSRFAEVAIFGDLSPRLANTSNFAIPGIPAETAVISLDLDGVMVSSGAACSSGRVQQSHVLSAMGVPHEMSRCGLRASFGWNSQQQDVEAVLTSLETLAARMRPRRAA